MKRTTWNPLLSTGGIGLLLVAAFLVDWLTGYEVSIFPLYLVSLFAATWRFGRWAGISTATLVAIGIATVEKLGGRPYSVEWLRYEHLASRLVVLLALVWIVDNYRRTLEANRQRLAALEKLLTICPGCGQIAGSDGRWYSAKDYQAMRERESYCICPRCEAARRNP